MKTVVKWKEFVIPLEKARQEGRKAQQTKNTLNNKKIEIDTKSMCDKRHIPCADKSHSIPDFSTCIITVTATATKQG